MDFTAGVCRLNAAFTLRASARVVVRLLLLWAVWLPLSKAAEPFAVRDLPDTYFAGDTVEVKLLVNPPVGTTAWLVTEHFPANWDVVSATDASATNDLTGELKFGPFTGAEPRVLSYVVRSVFELTGPVDFAGTARADAEDSVIGGDASVSGTKEWEFVGPQVLSQLTVGGAAYGAGRWVATAWGWSTTSTNGVNWTYPRGYRAHNNSRMAYLGGLFLWWGGSGTSDPRMAASEDGLTWRDGRAEVGQLLHPFQNAGDVTAVAFGNGVYVAVGSHWRAGTPEQPQGAIWRSTNGYHWTRVYRLLPSASRGMNAVAFGDDRFIGVGDNGTIVSSTDGLAWTETQNPLAVPAGSPNPLASEVLGSIGFGPHGWYILKGPGEGLHSGDGVTWSRFTAASYPGGRFYHSFHADGRYWFTGESGTYTTVDGTSWTLVLGGGKTILSVRRAPDGVSPRYLGGWVNGSIYASEDAVQWTRVIGGEGGDNGGYWPNHQVVVPAESEWLVSGLPAGPAWHNWNPPLEIPATKHLWAPSVSVPAAWIATADLKWRLGGTPALGDQLRVGKRTLAAGAIGRSDSMTLVAGFLNPVTGNLPATPLEFLNRSANLLFKGIVGQWDLVRSSLAATPSGFELFLEASHFCDASCSPRVRWGHFTSPDGTNWIRRELGLNHATNFPGIRALAWGAGRYVAVGTGTGPGIPSSTNRIFTSTDGETYSPVVVTNLQPPLVEGLTGVVFGNGMFIAVGGGGRILRSLDGLVWERAWSGGGAGFNRVRFDNNEFIAVGDQGLLVFSRDGFSWRQRPTGVPNNLHDVAFRAGEYLAVGENAMVLRAEARTSIPYLVTPARSDRRAYGVGGTVQLSVSADGSAPLRYQWYRLDAAGNRQAVAGASAATHTFSAAATDDQARFQVVIENEFGNATSDPVSFRVVEGLAPVSYAMLNGDSSQEERDNLYDGAGDSALDNAALSGGTGDLFDGVAVRWPDVEGGVHDDHPRWVAWRKLAIPEVTFDFGANAILSEVRLHTVNLGNSGGAPGAAAVAFSDDGTSFGPEQRRVTDFSAFAGGTHQYLAVPVSGQGRHVRVRLERRAGSGLVAVSEFRFEAMRPPTIAQPPASVSVQAGQSVQLTVGVEGSAPFIHRWFKDGQPLTAPDAPVLDLGVATLESSGAYHVEVSNLAGTALSNPALVTVLVPPAFTTVPQPASVRAGQTVNFTATVTGVPAPSLRWQWSPDGSAWTDLTDAGGVSGAATAGLTLVNVPENWNGRRYRLSATNPADTALSPPATLTVLPPLVAPTIIVPPANITVAAGQDALFSVTATGTAPLTYHWFFTPTGSGAEQSVEGATTATLVLAAVAPTRAGSYRVRVANEANSSGSFSPPATLTVTAVNGGFVNRRLPGNFVPGRAFEVVLEAKPVASVAFYALSDRPPTGWAVSGVNEGGGFDARTGEVKFGPFADNAARTLRYTLAPPATANGRFDFSGIASTDGTESTIGGTGFIENSVSHPADVSADLRLVITEVTGYGAAWKRGESWTLPPNPIPVNYVTRAGFLWRNGELYRLDPAAGIAPLWWVPDVAPSPTRVRQALNTASTVMRSFAEGSVTLAVTPADTVSVYAVEERLFAGFTAADVSHGGTFLSSEGLVRWGPFFDHQGRVLTYRVSAPAGFEGEIAVLGLVSEDGDSFPVTGDSVLRFGTAELPPPVTSEFAGDSFKLDVSGPLNARVVIETSDSLGGGWTVATEFELNKPDQSWSVPVEIQQSGKFFRVRVSVP
jgi:hypothetical protein